MVWRVIDLLSVIAISIGASLGAVSRWVVGVLLNDIFPAIPLGTLGVNLVGGYLIGVALSYFAHAPHIAAEWRLLIVTGFLGSLTTFSTFSMESASLLRNEKYLSCALLILAHVGGSITMTLLGIATFAVLRR